MGGDGDLASRNPERNAKAARRERRVKGRRGSDRSGNHHVTAHGPDSDSRTRVNVPRRWKAFLVVTAVLSSWKGGESGLGDREKRGVEKPRGCPEATRVSEVRLRRAARNKNKRRALTETSPPKRVRHREMPVPPVSWPRVQARGHGRGASLEEKPVAHEAWGTRSRSSGKQKSVARIVVVLRGSRKANHRRAT
jgi:hypothetical protein